MPRLLPKSLLGQTMVAIGAVLLIAQIISAVLLYRAAQNRIEQGMLNAVAINLLIDPEIRRQRFNPNFPDARSPFVFSRPALRVRTTTSNAPPFQPDEKNHYDESVEVMKILNRQGLQPHTILLTKRRAGDDPLLQERARRNPRFATLPGWADRTIVVAGIQLEDGGEWRIARVFVPDREPGVLRGIVMQTLLLFLLLVGALYLILRRITRPLAALTERVDGFSRRPDQPVVLAEDGPADMRQLIAAHNMMEARVAALIDEKDVMLGAIGHDLKTPLAALRVRIESVEDDRQRERMATSIEDITATLDDILILARLGRSQIEYEAVDLSALAASVVDEFEDLGKPVTMAETPRMVASVQVTWIKRALRNLVSNAVRYGGNAHVTLKSDEGVWTIAVEDEGPGISENLIETMLEPFARGEASRNRATGGAGLGLTLARAIAQQHGGDLSLANRREGGLIAKIRIPKATG